jgi:endonuclease YncB( thermonuclease family)
MACLVSVGLILGGLLLAPVAGAQDDAAQIPIRETGTVLRINDGDTFEMIPDGSSTPVRVRMLGINTPEVTGWKNAHFDKDMCGGPQAYQYLSSILPLGSKVQLRSNSAESTNRGRILRYAFAQNPATGAFDVDLQQAVARQGLAMWFSLEGESTMARTYRGVVDEAQAAGIGIWNPSFCTSMEQPDARLAMTVIWDSPGNDAQTLNQESVIIRNVGPSAVDVSGWLLRDSSLEAWLEFPAGTVLPPGDYLVAHSGTGVNGGRDFYMQATSPIFPNLVAGQFIGDGAYLLDRSTTPRAWFEYPCLSDCVSDPLKGRVVISKVNPIAGPGSAAKRANMEYVVVSNASNESVLLDGYFLRRNVSTYPFLPNTRLAPGKSLTVRIGRGQATANTQYWGMTHTLLDDKGDSVQLLSSSNVQISQKKW